MGENNIAQVVKVSFSCVKVSLQVQRHLFEIQHINVLKIIWSGQSALVSAWMVAALCRAVIHVLIWNNDLDVLWTHCTIDRYFIKVFKSSTEFGLRMCGECRTIYNNPAKVFQKITWGYENRIYIFVVLLQACDDSLVAMYCLVYVNCGRKCTLFLRRKNASM